MANAVRIISVPPGEAPLEVRQAWVGLVLPLARYQQKEWQSGGVLTGPKGFFGFLWRMLTGHGIKKPGYGVHVLAAIRVLEETHPEAAQWWRTHTPYLLRPDGLFIFAKEACQEIDATD